MTDAYAKLDDLIELAAVRLGIDFRDGYTKNYESDLANEAIGRLNAPELDEALDVLVRDHVGRMIAVNCLLDECDERSYEIEARLATELLGAIILQQRQEIALRQLMTDAVCWRHKELMLNAARS